jgi:hypothetical protein
MAKAKKATTPKKPAPAVKKKTAAKPAAKKKAAAKLGRSWLAGEVTLEEIRKLTKGYENAAPLFDDELLQGSIYDIVVADGDLRVDGDLDTFKHKLIGLVVKGNLTVTGLFTDTDDPACGVFVAGDMTAARIITTGELGVQGTLTATEALVGFYNDYGAEIGGALVTPLFHPENHHFEIHGKLEARVVVGYGAEYRVPKRLKAETLARIPKRLADVLVDKVIQREDDEEELDSDALMDRVRKGLPVLR